jgi:hypothetical protein
LIPKATQLYVLIFALLVLVVVWVALNALRRKE